MPLGDHPLHQRDEARVQLVATWQGGAGWLAEGTLDDPDPAGMRECPFEIPGGAVEICLKRDPYIREAPCQTLVHREHVIGALRALGADHQLEAALRVALRVGPSGRLRQGGRQAEREIGVNNQTEMGEVERDGTPEAVPADGIDDPVELDSGGPAKIRIAIALAEEVDRNRVPAVVDRPADLHGGFERLAGDEAECGAEQGIVERAVLLDVRLDRLAPRDKTEGVRGANGGVRSLR